MTYNAEAQKQRLEEIRAYMLYKYTLKPNKRNTRRLIKYNVLSGRDANQVEDAADYWKNEFEQLFNAIHRTVGDLNKSDEKCVSDVIDILIRYDGQSDEQLCTKQIGNY